MCRSQADGGRRCPHNKTQTSSSSRRTPHHHCYCVGSHQPGCPNYGIPDAMPPLTDSEQED